MILDSPITIYSNVCDRIGTPATFGQFLRVCLQYKQTIERLRLLPKEDAKRVKLNLPAATISGRFSPTRAVANLQEHSGLLCLDFDDVGNIPQLMELLASMDIVAYCSRSVSGRGVFAVVRIAYPDRHKEQFESLRVYFLRHGYQIDVACKDVCRLRVISFDSKARLRVDAVPYVGIWEEPRETYQPRDNNYPEEETEARVKILCDKIRLYQIDVTKGYSDWLNIGFALAELGESGREYFHAVSSVSPQYKRAECDRKFNECLKSRRVIGISYFFSVCRQEGLSYK